MSWARLVAAVPWLGTLPPELAARLDLTELVTPNGTTATIRVEVEHTLGAHVMTYRPGPHVPDVSERLQLCQALEPAALTVEGIRILRAAESHLDGIVLCAYARPLRIRPTADKRLSGSSAQHTPR